MAARAVAAAGRGGDRAPRKDRQGSDERKAARQNKAWGERRRQLRERVKHARREAGLEGALKVAQDHRTRRAYGLALGEMASEGAAEMARRALEAMREQGLKPHCGAYAGAIQAFGRAGDDAGVEAIFREVQERGIQPTPFLVNSFVRAKVRCSGSALKALERCEAMGGKVDAVSFNTVLSSCRGAEEVRWVYEGLKSRLPADRMTLSILCTTFSKEGKEGECLAAWRELVANRGVEPDTECWTALMSAFAKAGRPEEVERVSKDIRERMLVPLSDPRPFNAAIDAHFRAGNLESARRVLAELRDSEAEVDKVAWNQAVKVEASSGSKGMIRAFDLLKRSHGVSSKAGIEAYTTLVTAAGSNNRPDLALKSFRLISERGLTPDSRAWACLFRALARCGQTRRLIQQAKRLQEEPGDVKCLNASLGAQAIRALIARGASPDACLEAYGELRAAGAPPSDRLFADLVGMHADSEDGGSRLVPSPLPLDRLLHSEGQEELRVDLRPLSPAEARVAALAALRALRFRRADEGLPPALSFLSCPESSEGPLLRALAALGLECSAGKRAGEVVVPAESIRSCLSEARDGGAGGVAFPPDGSSERSELSGREAEPAAIALALSA